MGYLALYRKYRPNTFEGLIGQEHVVKTLVNQITSGRLGHAYLFTGTRGTGKTSAAKIFAKAINCLNNKNGSPCGECASCKAISDPANIDIIEIDAASNNGVNEIRELRENVQFPPVSCRYKVYIVDEVHMLTGPAFNALLKTLEEPPKHAVFILATTEVHKIPATILSRCMRFDFKLISDQQIASLIEKIYDEQGKKYQKEAVMAIAKAGEGSIRDALSIADIALSYSENALTYDDVMNILGSSNAQILYEFIDNVINGNTGAVLQTIDMLCSLGKSIGVLIKDITSIIRDIIVVKTCSNPNDILALPKEKFEKLNELSKNVSEQRLLRILEIFAESETSLRYSNHARIVFESASIKATKPESDYNIDALLARITKLENDIKNNVNKSVISETKNCVVESGSEKVAIEMQKQEVIVPKQEKLAISSISERDLKGRLLLNLRKIGSEMLWNLIQGVDIKVTGNILTIITFNDGDHELLDRSTTRDTIEQALEEFAPFELQVALDEKEKTLDAIDEEAKRLKDIFGEDIVIIKQKGE